MSESARESRGRVPPFYGYGPRIFLRYSCNALSHGIPSKFSFALHCIAAYPASMGLKFLQFLCVDSGVFWEVGEWYGAGVKSSLEFKAVREFPVGHTSPPFISVASVLKRLYHYRRAPEESAG